MLNIEILKENKVYKEILKDSFGGVVYMKNKEEYNITELLKLWDNLSDYEKSSIDGIMKGVISFVSGDF